MTSAVVLTIVAGVCSFLVTYGIVWIRQGGLRRHRQVWVLKKALQRSNIRHRLVDQIGEEVGYLAVVDKQVQNIREMTRLWNRVSRTLRKET